MSLLRRFAALTTVQLLGLIGALLALVVVLLAGVAGYALVKQSNQRGRLDLQDTRIVNIGTRLNLQQKFIDYQQAEIDALNRQLEAKIR